MSVSDESIPEVTESRPPIDTFKPMLGNVIAGFIISALVIAVGIGSIGFMIRSAYLADWKLPFSAEKGMCWLVVIFGILFGGGMLYGATLLISYCRGLLAHRVEVHENGFRFISGQSADEVDWSQVALIREIILYQRPPILKGPAKFLLPKLASTSYIIFAASGKEYGFDGDSIRGIERFGNVLRAHAGRCAIDWETVERHG